jgi:hypothetical protein
MYYTIELHPRHSLTIENIPASHFHDAIYETYHRKSLRQYTYNDITTIADQNQNKLTAYYKDEDRRNKMVSALLASGDYLHNHRAFFPPGHGDFMDRKGL